MNLKIRRCVQIAGLAAMLLSSAMFTSTAFAQSATGSGCRDPLAKSPKALFCEKYTTGFVTWRDSMQVPNNSWQSRGAIEVIVFDNYVAIAQGEGTHLVVPRDRIVYFGPEEIQ
jgi:hypothetical protein